MNALEVAVLVQWLGPLVTLDWVPNSSPDARAQNGSEFSRVDNTQYGHDNLSYELWCQTLADAAGGAATVNNQMSHAMPQGRWSPYEKHAKN